MGIKLKQKILAEEGENLSPKRHVTVPFYINLITFCQIVSMNLDRISSTLHAILDILNNIMDSYEDRS